MRGTLGAQTGKAFMEVAGERADASLEVPLLERAEVDAEDIGSRGNSCLHRCEAGGLKHCRKALGKRVSGRIDGYSSAPYSQ